MRFERLKKRSRQGDPKTFEDFKRVDNHENRGKTKGQNINACLKLVDKVIFNNSSMDKLKKEVDKIIS